MNIVPSFVLCTDAITGNNWYLQSTRIVAVGSTQKSTVVEMDNGQTYIVEESPSLVMAQIRYLMPTGTHSEVRPHKAEA